MYTQVISYPFDLIATPASVTKYTINYVGAGTPDSFEAEPNIIVTAPEPDTKVGDKIHVEGRARVFEGDFQVQLEDGHNVLYDKPVQGIGAPEWQQFSLDIPTQGATSPTGILTVFDYSARDGSKQDIVLLPVHFAEWK